MKTKLLGSVFAVAFIASVQLVVAGCGDDAGGVDAAPPDMARRVVNLSGTRSGVGASCQPFNGSQHGTCKNDASICLTDGQFGLNGGYCVSDCVSTGCPSDSDCIEIAPRFDLCMALCNTDADCRGSEGYVCSDFNICLPAQGLYLGSAIRPGTNGGEACDPTDQTPSTGFAPSAQISVLNGADPSIAVDETAGNVVIAWNDLFNGGVLVASSQDGGASFGSPIGLPSDNFIDNNDSQLDPAVAVDSTGSFFVAWLGTGHDPDAIYVARSTDGGASFPDVFAASPIGDPTTSLGSPSIAIGPDDTIYVAWNDLGAGAVRIAASTDGGATWTAAADVTSDAADHENPRVAVSSDLSVYVAWVEPKGDANGDVKNSVAMQKLAPDLTLDGGRVKMSSATDTPTGDVPAIAVDGSNVYVVYSAGSPQGQWDIRAAYSADGGTTVKPSVKVNSDATCATHFHPAAAVDLAGVLHVVYYDNRNLDGALRHQTATSGAATLAFSAEDVVNDMPFPFTTEVGGFDSLGSRVGLFAGDSVWLGWTDTRTNDTSQILFSVSQ